MYKSVYRIHNRGLFSRLELQEMILSLEEDQFNSEKYQGGGYTFDYVNNALLDSGFCDVELLNSFQISLNHDIFTHDVSDNSILTIQDEEISLNVLAKKCEDEL